MKKKIDFDFQIPPGFIIHGGDENERETYLTRVDNIIQIAIDDYTGNIVITMANGTEYDLKNSRDADVTMADINEAFYFLRNPE